MTESSRRCETVEAYLAQVGRCRGSAFGQRFRQQFRDMRGTAELAMLASPSDEEYQAFCRVVAAMSEEEKAHPERLDAPAMAELARRAEVQQGTAAIFINGFVLQRKKDSQRD